jgi:pimeloyl-ACP methyl ester carboxylesterase
VNATTSGFAPTVVFVHGILSSGATFDAMKKVFQQRGTFAGCHTFEYDYNRELKANGQELAERLAGLDGEIVLVGHSMGGLVARLAVLTGTVSRVKRVIMLGTPNFGAMRTASAGLLAQLVLQATGRVSAVFRRPGILELTRIPAIMKDAVAAGEPNARHVEYVTIPALFFNEARGSLEFGQWSGTTPSTKLFATLGVGMELLSLFPLWAPQMERPHDGIVEERSNTLAPDAAGRRSEKRRTLMDPQQWGYTYAHLVMDRCDDLNHVTLHLDPLVIELVADVASATSLLDWWRGLTPEQRLSVSVLPPPPSTAA